MSSRALVSALLSAVALAMASNAGAQVTLKSPTTATAYTRAPLATASYTPYSLGGAFGDRQIDIRLGAVSLSSPPGKVTLEMSKGSLVYVTAPQGLPDGLYSVAFAIPRANYAATLSATSSSGASTQCPITEQPLYAATAPVQTCELGNITVAGGKFDVQLTIAQGIAQAQIDLSQITVTRWR